MEVILRANRRNIGRCYMLRPFAHPVACCCAKFDTGQTLSHLQTDASIPNNVGSCWPTLLLRPFARGFKLSVNGSNNSQQCWELLANNVATVCNSSKHSLELLANNVASVCSEL